MMRMKNIVAVVAIALMVFSANAYATDNLNNEDDCLEINSKDLISIIEDKGNIDSKEVSAHKVCEQEKRTYLNCSNNIDIEGTDVYVVEKHIANNEYEQTVVANIETAQSGAVTGTKDGRVNITCKLKYEKRSFHKIPCIKGTWFGGKVNFVQNGFKVTKINALYHDVGPYYTANGSSGISLDYKKPIEISVSKMRTYSGAKVTRNKYFNVLTAYGSVDARYTVKYKNKGKTYSISVSVSAK